MKKAQEIEINCSSCRALCCRLEVQLIDDSDDQVPEEYTTKVNGMYTAMKQAKNGYCIALNTETMLCTIYEQRPFLCREYQAGDYDCMIEREKLKELV
ncbi:YkgJ family cysteine cluster protein [Halobacteriovorax sp. HLS]|uniref:YkgJ family cysteine cluster protein n=1 Tax=Halobacteriovorax sp. HLS TaxID=2234000 RepID=UPI000FDA6AB6|nr:YkgJ family cysteine cluster protein [Halobacteriovorax sp. HLS]